MSKTKPSLREYREKKEATSQKIDVTNRTPLYPQPNSPKNPPLPNAMPSSCPGIINIQPSSCIVRRKCKTSKASSKK